MMDIIVGVDRSDTARRAALTAAELAAKCGANLHVLTCVERHGSVDLDVGTDHFRSDPISEARVFLEDLISDLPHDSITPTVSTEHAAKALCDEAKRIDASIIVVGNRRVQGISRVLGSIAGDVMRHAPCHVLVAHTTPDD